VDRDLDSAVRIPAVGVILDGDLVLPARATGVVLFAHGSGSSRHSPRNRLVATKLQAAGYASVTIDPKGYRTGSLNEGLILRQV